MRYVDDLDPAAYLDQLPHLLGALPPGAARFAADPEHYDFSGLRCVKDLSLGEVRHHWASATAWIRFVGNPFKHDEDLLITYTGVSELRAAPIGEVRLDEMLPAGNGCTHEILGLHGTLRVTCADLTASWVRVPRLDDPPPGDWTPVLKLGDRWNWLGRHDGAWVVGVPHRRADPVHDRMDALLVVLDRPWPETTERWSALPASAPSLETILVYALRSEDWRRRLALGWLEQGCPVTAALFDALAATKDDRRHGQRDRHRAVRLWLANRGDAHHRT